MPEKEYQLYSKTFFFYLSSKAHGNYRSPDMNTTSYLPNSSGSVSPHSDFSRSVYST